MGTIEDVKSFNTIDGVKENERYFANSASFDKIKQYRLNAWL